jgi:hypothetical protein
MLAAMVEFSVPDPCDVIPICPVCESCPFKLARRTTDLDICICERCGTSLTVPHVAWKLRRAPLPSQGLPKA